MKTVISARDVEEVIRQGGDIGALPQDAIWTPSAKDLLRNLETGPKIRKILSRLQFGPHQN